MGYILYGRELIKITTLNQGIHKTKVFRTLLAAYILAILQVYLYVAHHLLTKIIAQLCISKLQYILHCLPFSLDIPQCPFRHFPEFTETTIIQIVIEFLLNILHEAAALADALL